MNAREFQQSEYFDNILISTIRFLESFPAKTPSEKFQFMRGLQRILPEFPASVLERKILGMLLEETKDRELLSPVLQNIFAILKRIPSARRIFPEKVVLRLKEIFLLSPAGRDSKRDAGLMAVLENVKVITDCCSGKDLKDGEFCREVTMLKQHRLTSLQDILPLIRLGLDSPTHSLEDAAIKCLPTILPILDFSTVKNEVFPPIAAMFSRTNSLAIKIRGLEAFCVLCGGTTDGSTNDEDDLTGVIQDNSKAPGRASSKASILDKYTIQEKLVPSLKAIKTKEPAVMMAVLNVLREVGKIADSEFIALEVFPILWAFSMGPLLDVGQFGEFMSLIKSLSAKVENEQTRKLQDLSSGGSSTRNDFEDSSQLANGSTGQANVDSVRNDFERLVLGRKSARNSREFDALDMEPAPAKPSGAARSLAAYLSSPPANNNPTFRTITPDYSMSSFPALEPTSKLQQQESSSSSSSSWTTAQWPAWELSSSSVWDSPKPASMLNQQPLSTLAGMGAPPVSIAQAPTSNYSAFSIAPPPAPTSQTNTGWASSGTTPFGPGFNAPSQPVQNTQKQGLDKYESLL